MDTFVPKNTAFAGSLNFLLKLLKKIAPESHRLLVEAYGERALSEPSCRKWFRKFLSGDLSVEDIERPGQSKKFED